MCFPLLTVLDMFSDCRSIILILLYIIFWMSFRTLYIAVYLDHYYTLFAFILGTLFQPRFCIWGHFFCMPLLLLLLHLSTPCFLSLFSPLHFFIRLIFLFTSIYILHTFYCIFLYHLWREIPSQQCFFMKGGWPQQQETKTIREQILKFLRKATTLKSTLSNRGKVRLNVKNAIWTIQLECKLGNNMCHLIHFAKKHVLNPTTARESKFWETRRKHGWLEPQLLLSKPTTTLELDSMGITLKFRSIADFN